MKTMAQARSEDSPVRVVVGGDGFLNGQIFARLRDRACQARPQAECMELDAADCDAYTFEEAVSPSLLSETSIVCLDNLQQSGDGLGQALVDFCKRAVKDPAAFSIVVARHEGGNKGRRLLDALVRAGAAEEKVPDLKKYDAKIKFVNQEFASRRRRIEPAAAQQLVNVLGERTGELAAMCSQLCFDFDTDPVTLDLVDEYLTDNPTATGFLVADRAVEGNTAQAIVAMRSAVEQGTDPIAIIGALALKLRMMGKVSAIESGAISQAEAGASPWQLRSAKRQLRGWTSRGLGRCIEALADADERCKGAGGDPEYALERTIGLIGAKGETRQ